MLETPGISTGYWKPRKMPLRGALLGIEFQQVVAVELHGAYW